MRKFKLAQSLIDRAQSRADKLPLLNNSIRKGEGALVAYIGEEIATVSYTHLRAHET